ncbi:LOW QUALITY PROTEIN: uncharacterized protein [Argopecten irradians]|uniref:LOW QUALITY PROTEIN: uncharacterized protein n=1 Tax=Argopecten irradians TaxID=31199 RepID=UPI00371C4F7B
MTTDQSREGQSITMTWTNVIPELFTSTRSITAIDTYTELTSPFYGGMLPPDLDMVWDIAAASSEQVVTVWFEELDLTYSELTLVDKDTYYSAKNALNPYISYSRTIRIILNSAASKSSNDKFKLKFKQGCSIVINPASSGTITSPGYITSNYPAGVTCDWTIIAPSPKSLTLRKRELNIHGNADFIKIYNRTNSPLHTGNGYTGDYLNPIIHQSDYLRVVFESDKVRSGEEFKFDYSVDCEPLTQSTGTDIAYSDSAYPTAFDSVVTVTCVQGYSYMQEDYINGPSVQFTCNAGGLWSLPRIPKCQVTYCPIPPKVSNGWISEASDGSGGVKVGANVTYICEDGFVISNPAPIKCQDDGTWEDPPLCASTSCNNRPFLSNGNTRNLTATVTQYGDVLQFYCNEGFETVGNTFTYCQTNGTWSHAAPVCQALVCPLVPVMDAEWDREQGVAFNQVGVLTCNAGYKWNNTNTAELSVTCMADGTYSNMDNCIDINECTENTHNCTGSEDCDNTVGGFICKCKNGYFRNETTLLCQDTDECAVNNGGCSHTCNENSPGNSYFCSCPTGYELYTEANQNNISLAEGETGLRERDVIYINHTCVRKTCGSLPHPSNGQRLTENEYTFYYEDTVYFDCNLGYVMSGDKNITCQADQQWSASPPTCNLATCSIPTLGRRMTNTSQVDEKLTVECEYGNQVVERMLYCNFVGNDQYNWVGNNFSCPEINCGDPMVVPGSVYSASTGNSWKDTFTFGCDTGFSPSGMSTTNDFSVMCQENGRWGFGNLTCTGSLCVDPGTPTDAIQIATSYEVGQEVYWTCTRDGFTPYPPTVLKCEINSFGNVTWNSTVRPSCKDTQAPTINNCPTEPIYVQKSTAVSYITPVFTDVNTGYLKILDVQPNNIQSGTIINQNTTIVYTAEDYAGNTATCEIPVIVIDGSAPILSCPNTSYHYINTSAGYSINPLTDISSVVLPSMPGVTYVANPPMVTVNFASLGTLQKVTITGSYRNLLQSSCSFIIATEASGCLTDSVKAVAYSGKSCAADSFSCSLPCAPGHVHYDTGLDNKEFNCTGANVWSPPLSRLPCVDPQNSLYSMTVNATFDVSGRPASECVGQFQNDSVLVQAFQQKLACDQTTLTISPIVEAFVTDTNTISSLITITLDLDTLGAFKSICADSVNARIDVPVLSPLTNPTSPITCTGGQATVTPDYTKSEVIDRGNTCLTPGYVLRGTTVTNQECVPTLTGTYEVNDMAVSCSDGMYQDLVGQTSCKSCGAGTAPDTAKEKCIETCPPGFISDDGFPPCYPCEKDSYSSNSTYCESCPSDTSTGDKTGMSQSTDCKAQCQPGSFSATGYEPCTECPMNFYQDSIAQTHCMECSTDEITSAVGSNSSSMCIASSYCTTTPCNGNGICSVINHVGFCTCNAGYTGSTCNNMLNYCATSPCVNGQCNNLDGTDYNCTCYSGYAGKNCDISLADGCGSHQCEAGSCRSVFNPTVTYECLCPTTGGYAGDFCRRVEDLCAGTPCKNQATCVAYGSVRKQCICRPGFTGDDCETNIDDCAANPAACAFNGTCVDEVNGFRCDCEPGFSGPSCTVAADFCTTDPCPNAECYNDYDKHVSVCVCHDGYQLDVNGKCILNDPCIDGNCCNEGNQGVYANGKCICAQGYTGSQCQHDVIDCTPDSCQNGGICQDITNGVQCICKSGYTGDQCQTNIDDCVGQCTGDHIQAADRCMDKVNDYMCNCEDGWKGQNCTVNIDECASYPCMHGANCTDGDNTYTCDCLTGWTGQDCSTPVNFCESVPCLNEGECYNMNNGYFCSCLGGTTGTTCSTFPPVCPVIRPCSVQGTCRDVEGSAKCDCSTDDYTGSSCQLIKDHCADNPCKNGGSCTANSDLGFTCACRPSYSGTTCSTYSDPCNFNPCTSGAVCMSDGNMFTCSCPGGAVMTDSQCKSSSPIGDMIVDASVNYGGTYLNNPIMFNDGESFSVMFWVICSNDTYASPSIMALEPRNIGQNHPEMTGALYNVKVSNDGVVFSNNSQSSLVEFKKNICDKKWHHLSFAYHQSGLTFVKLDFTTILSNQTTASGITAKMFQVVLGKNFHGRLHKVEMWNTWLTREQQVNASADLSYVPSPGNIIQRWMNYAQTSGVTFTSATLVRQVVCDKGLAEDSSCVQTDKIPPTLVTCPDSMKKLVGPGERVVNIPNLRMEGSSYFSNFVSWYSNVEDGETYLPGRYNLAAYAIDEQDNFAQCHFPLYIQYDTCPDPIVPGGTLGTCSVDSETKPCFAECPIGEDLSGPTPKRFHCTNLGVYNPAEPYLPQILPPCASASESNTREVAVELIYDVTVADCGSSTSVLNDLNTRLRSRLESSGVCGSGCTISTNVRCQTPTGRVVLVGFVLSGLGTAIAVRFNGNTLESYSPSEAVYALIYITDTLDFQTEVANAVLRQNMDSISVEESVSCSSGFQAIGTQCVQCSQGQYYDSSSKTCMPCAMNYYQDEVGMSTCKPCSGNNVTFVQGSPDASYCVDNCTAGNFYNDTAGTCLPCPKDMYQEHYGKNYCNFCPITQITTTTGANSSALCNDDCSPGYERSPIDQQCVKCPRGTYRIPFAEKCIPCSAEFTTKGEATPDASGCDIRICYNGTFRNASNDCEVCPYGYYQDEDLQDECKKCGDSESTMDKGSNHSSQCIFVCEAGKYVSAPGQCLPCDRGYYHTGEHPQIFQPCQQCPTNKTTELSGSNHMDNCSLPICDKGQEINSTSDGCMDCPYNTFQDKYMPTSTQTCASCGGNRATVNMKSTSFDDCLLYCPEAGTYDIGEGVCESCPRGTYRSMDDHSTAFSPCMNCSSGWTTEGEHNIGDFNCSIEICSKGQELNSSGYCVDCPYDTYQDVVMPTSADRCKPCLSNEATVNMSSTDSTDCKPYCTQPGTEFDSDGNCVACPRGTYRSIDDRTKYFTSCTNCTTGRTTETDGSISDLNCSIDECSAGYVVTSSGTCEACPTDTYQPMMYPNSDVKCTACGTGKATLENAQVSASSCVRVCTAGNQYNNESDQCEPCPKGLWNNGNDTMKFQQCALCPTNYTTVAGGNTDIIANCTLLDCAPGSYISGDNCLLCDFGKYQPNRHQDRCEDCQNDYTTASEGTIQQTNCYEKSRYEFEQGYYTVAEGAGSATITIRRISGTNGSNTIQLQANNGLATAGSDFQTPVVSIVFADSQSSDSIDIQITDDAIDETDEDFSITLISVDNRGMLGSLVTTNVTILDDDLRCDPGFSGVPDTDPSNLSRKKCEKCQADTIKKAEGLDDCVSCAVDYANFTANDARTDCDVLFCDKGFKYDGSSNPSKCLPCEQGTYKSERGQATTCESCDPGYTTAGIAASNQSQCDQLYCVVGWYFDAVSDSCQPCVIGTYKDTAGNINCTDCDPGLTTPFNQATSNSDCSIVVCPAGQKRNEVTNTCQPCALGEYQPNPGSTGCLSCTQAGYSTQFTGTELASGCIPICSPGQQYNETSKMCMDCGLGTYKSLNGNWQSDGTTVITCTACPTNRTTTAVASTSSTACSLELCPAGTFQQSAGCVACAKGSYQNLIGETSCIACDPGDTTKHTGATSASDCILNCPLGKQYSSSSGICVDCAIGYYVNKSISEDCIQCPLGTTNTGTGSADCRLSAPTPVTVSVQVSFSFVFRVTNFDCSNSNNQDIYVSNVRVRLIATLRSYNYNLCIPSSTCDNIQALTVSIPVGGCNQIIGNGRRRKRATDANLSLNAVVQPLPNPATSTTQSGVVRPVQDVVNEAINSDPTSIAPPGSTLTSAIVGTPTPVCNAGSIINSGSCVPCAVGTYESNGACVNCPVNKYQDLTGQTSCKLCSATSSVKIYTTGTNSTSATQCVSVCAVDTTYCKNGGTCVAGQTVYCQCGARYSGSNCETRSEPDNSTWIYIVAGTIGGIVFIVILIIIAVVACRRPRYSKPKYEKEPTPRTNYGYQGSADNVGFPYQYPMLQPSMTQALPETYYLPYQQPYQQPRAIGSGRYRGFEVDDDNASGYKWTSFSER